MTGNPDCPLCGARTEEAGSKQGRFNPVLFFLRQCPRCRYSFVTNPWTDYPAIYSPDYYAGKGADPLIDYSFELAKPERTIRRYEWQGIVKVISNLIAVKAETRWLDFGCGNGGPVRHVRDRKLCQIVGFDESGYVEQVKAYGIPLLNQADLDRSHAFFDVITAIEVLEHVVNPLPFLKQIKQLLKPGGLFFLTTGNAAPFRGRLHEWNYVVPEIHVSFFEPETLAHAFESAGLRPEFRRFVTGFGDIIRFKVLKNLRVRETHFFERMLPWGLLGRVVDRRFGVTDHPIGWA